jgi:enamine deaminase RidA (YjgF/YER057c/UK114 family)
MEEESSRVRLLTKMVQKMVAIVRKVTNPGRGRAISYNRMIFLGGQTADDCDQDIRGQTQQVLAKVDEILSGFGTHKGRLLSAQIWLKDIARDFSGMNSVWDAWVLRDAAPARATAQCEMADPEILVEIIVTAAAAD